MITVYLEIGYSSYFGRGEQEIFQSLGSFHLVREGILHRKSCLNHIISEDLNLKVLPTHCSDFLHIYDTMLLLIIPVLIKGDNWEVID